MEDDDREKYEKWEEGTRASSPEERRWREGRLWSRRAGGAKDIQRGPTVVVSDGAAASTHPANTHQEPDTHTCAHTPSGLALSV